MNYFCMIRVDARLIHGQVALVWSNIMKVTRIMIVDDEVINSTIQLQLLKMACPSGVKLSVLKPSDAARNILAGKYKDDKVFLVVKKPEMLNQLYDLGVHFDRVNVGNLPGGVDTVLLKKDVCVTKEQIETFKELSSKGVQIYAQTVPNDPEIDVMKLIEKL